MKRVVLLLFLLCSMGFGQSNPAPFVQTGLTAASTDCSTAHSCLTKLNLPASSASATIQLSGTFSGTVQFEAATADGTWVALNAIPLNSTTAVTSATSTGVWRANVSATSSIRVRCSTFSSGPINVTISWATGAASTGSGSSGNTTSASMTTNTLPKATGANAIGDSSISDDGTTVTTTDTGGFSAPNANPSLSGAPVSCPLAASSKGSICIDSAANRPVYSYNGGAKTNIVLATDPSSTQYVIGAPSATGRRSRFVYPGGDPGPATRMLYFGWDYWICNNNIDTYVNSTATQYDYNTWKAGSGSTAYCATFRNMAIGSGNTYVVFYGGSSATANTRWATGLTDTLPNNWTTDTPAGNWLAFLGSSGTTNFQCAHSDGATPTLTDSGVAFDNAIHKFEIIGNSTDASFTWKIDGTAVCGAVTTNIPASGTNVGGFWVITDKTTVTPSVKLAWLYAEANR